MATTTISVTVEYDVVDGYPDDRQAHQKIRSVTIYGQKFRLDDGTPPLSKKTLRKKLAQAVND